MVRCGGPLWEAHGALGLTRGRVGVSAVLGGLNKAVPSASPWLCTWPCRTYFPSLGLFPHVMKIPGLRPRRGDAGRGGCDCTLGEFPPAQPGGRLSLPTDHSLCNWAAPGGLRGAWCSQEGVSAPLGLPGRLPGGRGKVGSSLSQGGGGSPGRGNLAPYL